MATTSTTWQRRTVFQGEVAQAMEAALHLLEYKENPREQATLDNNRTAYRQGWFALMRTLVQNERWGEILDGTTLPVYDKPRELAWRHWAAGIAQAARRNGTGAAEALDSMDEALDSYQEKVKQAVPAELRVARMELHAQILIARNKLEEGFARLEKIAAREASLIYSEPPFYPRPVNEALGRLALAHSRFELAERAFRGALDRFPASHIATRGLDQLRNRNATSGPAGLE